MAFAFLIQRPQLVKGNMQLYSVDQQRSQALEAHAASFATFRVHLSSHTFDVFLHSVYVNQVTNVYTCLGIHNRRFQEMTRIPFLYLLHQKPLTLVNFRQSCTLLNSVLKVVIYVFLLIVLLFIYICFFAFDFIFTCYVCCSIPFVPAGFLNFRKYSCRRKTFFY